jgi:hypothetical protein
MAPHAELWDFSISCSPSDQIQSSYVWKDCLNKDKKEKTTGKKEEEKSAMMVTSHTWRSHKVDIDRAPNHKIDP